MELHIWNTQPKTQVAAVNADGVFPVFACLRTASKMANIKLN